MDDEIYRNLEVAAAREHRPVGELIQEAVSDYLVFKAPKSCDQPGLKRFLESRPFNLTDEQFREIMEADYYDQ